MNFCSECAHPVTLLIPADDTRLRHVCGNCGTIHYQNPKLVVGSIPLWFGASDGQPRVLLCRRAIEPQRGYWTLPAGFMENNETTAEAAARETVEEAGASIELHGLFSLFNVPNAHQVHLFYMATLRNLDYQAGVESLEVRMFSEAEIPWQDIAFPTTIHTLQFLFADLARETQENGAQRSFGFHTLDLYKPMRPSPNQ